MKEYIKNKNFIPYNIYKQSIQNNSKCEIRIIIIFIFANILLFSFNIKQNNKIKERQNDMIYKTNEIDKKDIDYSSIIDNCKILFDKDIISVNVDNGEGNIVINDLATIEKLEENKKIKLKEVNFDKEYSNYKVKLNIND